VPATWDCVCMNALPEMMITMNYKHDHGSNLNFSINMTVPLCDTTNLNTWLWVTIFNHFFFCKRNQYGIHVTGATLKL
jgi:hypothetical protein